MLINLIRLICHDQTDHQMVAPCLSKADCSIPPVQLSKQHTEVWDEDGFEQVKLHPQEVWWQWVNSKDGNDMTHDNRASATAAVAVASQPTPAVLTALGH